MRHIRILSKSCSAIVLLDIIGAALARSERDSRKWDEVNVKSGKGSSVREVYGMPRKMRKVFGDGDGVGIRGANDAGWVRVAIASQSTDAKKGWDFNS
jgi:hypothetical protein